MAYDKNVHANKNSNQTFIADACGMRNKICIWHQSHFWKKIHEKVFLGSGVFGACLLPLGLGIDLLFWRYPNHSCCIWSVKILYEFHWRLTPPAKPSLAASATMSLHSTKQPSCTINLCRRKLQPRLTPKHMNRFNNADSDCNDNTFSETKLWNHSSQH